VTPVPSRIVLALGSNLGDRLAYLRQGLEALREHVTIGRVSRVVESPPWGPVSQPPFLNLVLSATTSLPPHDLLDRMQRVESEAGRTRELAQGPRTLDVDLIFFEDLRLEGPRLTLPHPSWRERPFVSDLLGDLGISDPDSGRPFEPASEAALEARGLKGGAEVRFGAGPGCAVLIPSTLRAEAAGTVRVRVATSDGSRYPVQVGAGALADLSDLLLREARAHRYVLMGDDRVMELHGDTVAEAMTPAAVDPPRLTFPAGEAAQEPGGVDPTERRAPRGGVRAGHLRDRPRRWCHRGPRGVRCGHIHAGPSRGADAHLHRGDGGLVGGGKTGVDVPAGKNLIGAFHPPAFVLADTRLARTLPETERSQGLAEAVKHGAILDADYLGRIERDAVALLSGEEGETARMVARSVELKAGIVSRDEKESGLREVLNFGHTFGHAIEASSGYRLPHGSAISIGMVMEARLGERLGVTAGGTSDRLRRALEVMRLPTAPESPLPVAEILGYLGRDKKARSGTPRFVLLAEIGRVAPDESGAWSHPVSPLLLEEVLRGGPPGT
jgi:3-dehydroquinate synthase